MKIPLYAKAGKYNLCDCPNSEPGKVKIDIDNHLPGCRFRKRINRYAHNTSVAPREINDGYALGVLIGPEGF